jgi:hypothetical protein
LSHRAGLLLAAVTAMAAGAGRTVIGNFSAGDLSLWEPQTFHGQTAYRILRLDGERVLQAESAHSASALVRRIRVDLTLTPVLHCRWRAENILHGVDERTKAGDDYPARVYAIVSEGVFFWKKKAVNYVWSSHQPPGTVWPNAFARNVMMVAVGSEHVAQWVEERRNVRRDFLLYFGDDVDVVDAVAVMTDTDNSGQSAVACYGDMYFAAD